MKLFKIIIFFLVAFQTANAQLVNSMQRSEKRTDILRAFEEKRIVKILDRKYAIEDVNYFYFDHSKSPDYSIYAWAGEENFKVSKDSVNLSEVRVRNLKTGMSAVLRYPELYKMEIRVLKRKLRHAKA